MAIPLVAAAVAPLVGKLLDGILDLFPDTKAKEKAEAQLTATLLDYASKQDMAQLEINKNEAVHTSIFVAGWRPFIGWTCGVCIAWIMILDPLLRFAISVWIPDFEYVLPTPPESFWEIILGMLGLGGLRTFEKHKGICNAGK